MNNAIIDYSSKKTRCNCWRNFKLVKLFNFNMLSINQWLACFVLYFSLFVFVFVVFFFTFGVKN